MIVKFSEEDLKQSNWQKTLMKASMHYHPDKKSQAGTMFGDDKLRQEFLRNEISIIINLLMKLQN